VHAKIGDVQRARGTTSDVERATGDKRSWTTGKAERTSDMPETSIVLEVFGLQGSLNRAIEGREQSSGHDRARTADQFSPCEQMTDAITLDTRRR
jgi:hypothetical protein